MSATRRARTARRRKHQIASQFDALKNHRTTLSDVLQDPPTCLGRVHIYTLLVKSPGLHEAGANKVLKEAKVWPTTPISKLEAEERERIIAHLPPRAKK